MSKQKKEAQDTTKPNSLDALKNIIDGKYGSGAVMVGRGAMVRVDAFPTGIATLDEALGCGGIPYGRIIELYGTESCGKTTTCLEISAACQRHFYKNKNRKGVVAYIDAEHALDMEWASRIGVDVENLMLSQPNSGNEALDIAETMAKSGLIDLIVIDSAAALVPKEELDGDLNDANIGAQARMLSKGLRKLTAPVARSKTTIMFINQIREKIGVMFGNPETTPGGRALKFHASIRMEMRKGSSIEGSDKQNIGFQPTVKVVKNKVAPPFRVATYTICNGTDKTRVVYGVDKAEALITMAAGAKIIQSKGSHYSYKDQVIGNGRAKAAAFLDDNPKVMEEIRLAAYDKVFGGLKDLPEAKVIVDVDTDEDDDQHLENPLLEDDDE